jgi:hypothetical protein
VDVFALLVAIGLTVAVTVAIGLAIAAGLFLMSRLETPKAKPPVVRPRRPATTAAEPTRRTTRASALVSAERP